MSRSLYSGLVILVGIGAILFLYRTPAPSVQQPSVAEFGGVSLRIEYATTTAARELGLGGRKSIAPDEAMLFVFSEDEYYGFWMKDTLMPLDIFWIDSKGHVVSIAQDIATSTYPNVFYPTAPARYVLETAAGFAREHGITLGTPLLLKSFPTVSK